MALRRYISVMVVLLLVASPASAQYGPFDPSAEPECQSCDRDEYGYAHCSGAATFGGSAWNPCSPTLTCYTIATSSGYQTECTSNCGGRRCYWA